MPVYNGMLYLRRAVESIRGQTCPAWELIAVDDGSTDGSTAYLHGAAASDQRIRVVEHAANRGVGAAYNSGLAVANGRYIAFQEQDDISLPFRLDRQVLMLRSHDVPITSARVALLDVTGVVYGYWPYDILGEVEITPPGYRLGHQILVAHTNIANTTMMFDRDRLDPADLKFDEQFRRCCQDADLQIRLARKYGMMRSSEVLVHMFRFETHTSATTQASSMVSDMRRLLRKHGGRLAEGVPRLAALGILARAWANQLLFEARCRRQSWQGWGLALLSFLLWPGNPSLKGTVRNRIGRKTFH
jgi:glycosyltransferase involved in cell wall biosynthesis